MRFKIRQTRIITVICVLLLLSHCSGCSGIKWHPVYNAAVAGAVVGVVIGHQYNEDCQGAAIGAAVAATGPFLEQYDELSPSEKIIVEITAEDGSIVPVVLNLKDGVYYCPRGEYFTEIPNLSVLRTIYGI